MKIRYPAFANRAKSGPSEMSFTSTTHSLGSYRKMAAVDSASKRRQNAAYSISEYDTSSRPVTVPAWGFSVTDRLTKGRTMERTINGTPTPRPVTDSPILRLIWCVTELDRRKAEADAKREAAGCVVTASAARRKSAPSPSTATAPEGGAR